MLQNIDILINIGFNRLEAEVYVHLLTHPPSTAYKIGKLINKPTANVYKAIDALAKKGAVLIENNKNKSCKAVNPDEYLNLYERNISEKTKVAKKFLKTFNNEFINEKSYSIESVPLVFERFRTMMRKCKTIAVIDAFPKALNSVIDSIEAAVNRGIDVYIEAYAPIKIKGADVTCANIGEQALEHWKSQQLNLIIDGEEHLIALMDNNLDTVIQATWSNNLYMSCILHAGRLHEQTTMKILSKIDKLNFEDEVKNILDQQKYFYNTNIPGFNKLFKR